MLENIKWWLVLSTAWQLVDVQAGLVVVISLLSFIAVFTSARYLWHTSARRISKNADVPISYLLSFTTMGEVLDVVILLKSKLLQSQHFRLTVQCILVLAFSASAILAGPISRYATRIGSKDGLKGNHGHLASQSYNCEIDNSARWRNISDSLNRAKFPHDQLLDFLPDTSSDWVYHEADWNATHTAKCSVTTEANITLEAKGNYVSGTLGIYKNIPGLLDVFSAKFTDDVKNSIYNVWWSGTTYSDQQIWESMVLYNYAEYRPDRDGSRVNWTTQTQHLSVHLSMVGMHGVPMYTSYNTSSSYTYPVGKGKIPQAWYTKVECDITRTQPEQVYNFWQANVDNADCDMSVNMNSFFYANSTIPQSDNTTMIVLPTGDELFRFYQAYTIAKDTHFPHPVIRNINHRLPTVEISTFFIAVMSFITVIVIIVLIYCIFCRFYYSDLYKRVPETKVDWLLQSLREAESNTLAKQPQPASVTSAYDEYPEGAGLKQTLPWEHARYSIGTPFSASSDGYTTRPTSSNGLGTISVHRDNGTPKPPSLIAGPVSSPPPASSFTSFVNSRNGYSQLPNPVPYTGATPPPSVPYPQPSPAPSYISDPMSPSLQGDRVVSYGMASARAQPVLSIGPRSEKAEWQVGVVESRH